MLAAELVYKEVDGVNLDTFKPLPHHLCLRWLKKEETKGGVLIPQYRQRKLYARGVVLSVGPEVNPRLYPGRVVMFNISCEKEWLGVQDPADRDTVFTTMDENVLGTIERDGETTRVDCVDGWILIKPDEGKDYVSGLVRSEITKEQERFSATGWFGFVESVGEDVECCKVGDRVAYQAGGSLGILLGDHMGTARCLVLEGMIMAIAGEN